MIVTFLNVTITMEAPSAKRAYDDFCDLLHEYDQARGGGVIEWETDEYSVDGGDQRDTSELWPE